MNLLIRQQAGLCLILIACCVLPGCDHGATSTDFVPKKRERRVGSPPKPVVWRTANKAENAIARSIVQQQFRAFRNNDYDTAFNLMAPEMRNGASKSDQLRSLITNNYPEFAQVTRIRWINTVMSSDGAFSMHLRFMARNGNIVGATYIIRKELGRYLISGIYSQPLRSRRRNRGTSISSENAALEQFFRAPASAG